MKKYDVLMAVMRPQLAASTLFTLINQRAKPYKIIIKDNGKVPATMCHEFRMALDILVYEGIALEYFRGHDKPQLAPSRNELVKRAESDICVFSDDDVMWRPDTGEVLYDSFSDKTINFAVPTTLTANAECNIKDFFFPTEIDAHPQFTRQSKPMRVSIPQASGCVLFFRKNLYRYEWLENYSDSQGDDVLITRNLKKGIVNQLTYVWHLLSPTNRVIPYETEGKSQNVRF